MQIFRDLAGYVVFDKETSQLPSDFALQIKSLPEYDYLDTGMYIDERPDEFKQEKNILRISFFDGESEGIEETLENILNSHGALFFIYYQKITNSSTPGHFFEGPETIEFENRYKKKEYAEIKEKIGEILDIKTCKINLEQFIFDSGEELEEEILTDLNHYLEHFDEYSPSILKQLDKAIDLYDPFYGNEEEELDEMALKIAEI